MVTPGLPPALASWREAPRVRPLNDRPPGQDGRYVLCWVQQALRARDKPVIDAAVRLGNASRLPVLVYHGVQEDYPYASDQLHRLSWPPASIWWAAAGSAGWPSLVTLTGRAGARRG